MDTSWREGKQTKGLFYLCLFGWKEGSMSFKVPFNVCAQFPEYSTEIHDILGILHDPILAEFLKNNPVSLVEGQDDV